MPRILTSVLAGMIMLSQAGCSGAIIVNEPVFRQNFADGDLEYAARAGVLKTQVFGAPFGTETAEFAALVAGHMGGANRGPEIIYATGPRGARSDPYHVVVVFNPDRAVPAENLCTSPATIPTAKGTQPLVLLAGFCIEKTLLSTADGWADNIGGIAGPRFRKLIRSVTLSLFPARDYWDIGDERWPL